MLLVIYQISFYLKKNYKLILTDLSKQLKLKDPKQINFIGKLENQDHGVTMFLVIEKSEETTLNFSQNCYQLNVKLFQPIITEDTFFQELKKKITTSKLMT